MLYIIYWYVLIYILCVGAGGENCLPSPDFKLLEEEDSFIPDPPNPFVASSKISLDTKQKEAVTLSLDKILCETVGRNLQQKLHVFLCLHKVGR